MSNKKKLFVNLITTLIVLIINIFINFGLSSYIVENIGEEAYGFISLANNFVSYATIFTMAINSMSSRFITIDIHKKNYDSANKYFSSVLIANIIIVLLLIVPSIIFILYLDLIIKVPVDIMLDVKLLFTFIFLNFFVTLFGGVFTIATYCTNMLYLSSIKNLESIIIKAIAILIMFMLFKPAVFYVGIATLISSVFVVFWNIKFTKRLLPDIKIKKSNFSISKIKTLLSSGLWNSLTNLGNVLADGLDLIITNLMINPSSMGLVAIAKIPSNVFNTVLSHITNVFQPQVISYYSKDDFSGVVSETKKGMRICGLFGNIPFAYIIVFGFFFCDIWMSNVDINSLNILIKITFINIFVSGITGPLYNLFTITNNVKFVAILNILCGIISTSLVFLFLKITNLGAYAVVGISTLIWLIKGFVIVPIYAAKCLNQNKTTFILEIIKYCFFTFVICVFYYLIRIIFVPSNWLEIFVSVIICGLIGILINILLLFNSNDRIEFMKILNSRLKKNKL